MPPKITYPCLMCKVNVTKKTGGVRCDYCERWAHAKCCDISPGHLKCLNEMKNASWKCDPCMAVSKKIKQEIVQIQLKQSEMCTNIEINRDEIANHSARLEKVEKKQSEMNKEDIVQSSKEAMMEELREQRARRNNLVIHQIPEPPANLTRGYECKDYDTDYVIKIFKFLDAPLTKEGIKFLYRPGERMEAGRPRPVIMSLKDPGLRDYILDNTRKLANSSFNSISIIPDLTQDQRKEEEKLRKTAEKRNRELDPEEGLNWEWVLVGMRGDRRLIKRKIIQPGGVGGGRGDSRRSGSALTGANRTQLNTRPAVQQQLRRDQLLPLTTRGGGGGRGEGRGRGNIIREEEIAQPTQTTRIPAPTISNPATPTIMLPVEGEGEEEEGEERGSLEIISQMDMPALRVDDLPSDDEEEVFQTTQENNMENMEAGEPQKPSKEDRKRLRGDSKSPPDSRNRKKSAK